jgi:predicted small secreted protein
MERRGSRGYDPPADVDPEPPMRPTLTRCLFLAALLALLSACNTMRGLGKDIEKAGELIQDTADKNR